MRKTTLILFASLGALSALAQDDDERRSSSPPVENLYFATDEFVYIPRNTVYAGFRVMSGAKASFGGRSLVYSPNVAVGNSTDSYAYRTYYDGYVGMDTRTDADGIYYQSPDGLTNTWGYNYNEQASMPGYIAMHNYMAEIQDTTPHQEKTGPVAGFELTLTRDLKQLGSKSYLCLTGAIGMNDLRAKQRTTVPAVLMTMTDYYSLNGAAAPGEEYTAPTSTTISVVDANGNSQTVYNDNTILIDSSPSRRITTYTSDNTLVTNTYRIKGAFFSMRLGPTIYFPIWGKFRASVSAGLSAVYAGTTFTIDESYAPLPDDDVETPIETQKSDIEKKMMMGYYVDANLEYWITERAGLYAGASYQTSSDYSQTVRTPESEYSTKVEFKGMTGMRAGMNLRF